MHFIICKDILCLLLSAHFLKCFADIIIIIFDIISAIIYFCFITFYPSCLNPPIHQIYMNLFLIKENYRILKKHASENQDNSDQIRELRQNIESRYSICACRQALQKIYHKKSRSIFQGLYTSFIKCNL